MASPEVVATGVIRMFRPNPDDPGWHEAVGPTEIQTATKEACYIIGTTACGFSGIGLCGAYANGDVLVTARCVASAHCPQSDAKLQTNLDQLGK